jgi:hypothetical protein
MKDMKKYLLLVFQICAASIIALEVAIPPNPWKQEIIIIMVILICIKYDIVDKIENIMNKHLK